jgi:hypothetical protein
MLRHFAGGGGGVAASHQGSSRWLEAILPRIGRPFLKVHRAADDYLPAKTRLRMLD